MIRGGPDTFVSYDSQLIVGEQRLPVCSPALLRQDKLNNPEDLERHTLLHVATMPRLWGTWLALAGCPNLRPASALILDHFFLAI